MSSLREIVKPLLDAGVGPLQPLMEREYFETPDRRAIMQVWTDLDGGSVFDPAARLMWIGWLVEEMRFGLENTGPVNPVWTAVDPRNTGTIFPESTNFDLLACLVKAWEVRREQ